MPTGVRRHDSHVEATLNHEIVRDIQGSPITVVVIGGGNAGPLGRREILRGKVSRPESREDLETPVEVQ